MDDQIMPATDSLADASPKLKAGDVVQLKSGGPTMTVVTDEPNSNRELTCAWFFGYKCRASIFHVDALKIFDVKPVAKRGRPKKAK